MKLEGRHTSFLASFLYRQLCAANIPNALLPSCAFLKQMGAIIIRILFVTTAGEVQIYDAQGKRVRAMSLPEGASVTPTDASPLAATHADGKHDDESDDDRDEGKEGSAGTGGKGRGRVVSVDWYDGAEGLLHPRVPTLCIALDSGVVQLSRGTDDPAPVVINTHMTIKQARGGKEPTLWKRSCCPCG